MKPIMNHVFNQKNFTLGEIEKGDKMTVLKDGKAVKPTKHEKYVIVVNGEYKLFI